MSAPPNLILLYRVPYKTVNIFACHPHLSQIQGFCSVVTAYLLVTVMHHNVAGHIPVFTARRLLLEHGGQQHRCQSHQLVALAEILPHCVDREASEVYAILRSAGRISGE